MRTDYPGVIVEDEPTLPRVERQVRGRPTAIRVQALRLLKSRAARSLAECATVVGPLSAHGTGGGAARADVSGQDAAPDGPGARRSGSSDGRRPDRHPPRR